MLQPIAEKGIYFLYRAQDHLIINAFEFLQMLSLFHRWRLDLKYFYL